jgi:hypothetical protein
VAVATILLCVATIGVLASTSDRRLARDEPRWLPAAGANPSTSEVSQTTSSSPTTIRSSAEVTTGAVPAAPTAPGPTPPASETPAGSWRRGEIEGSVASGSLHDVVAVDLDERAVLLGAGTDGERPLVLFSEGGNRWGRLTQSGFDPGGAARAVGADASRVVTVGIQDGEPATWELRGEGRWVRRRVEGAADATVVLSSVAVHGDTTIVTGFDSGGAGIWTATGDADLARLPVDALDGAVEGETIVRDVVVVASELVAVGRAAEVPYEWRSVDGRRWRGRALQDPDGGGSPVTVSADGTAIGGYDSVGGVVWRAERRWRVPAPTERPQRVDAIASSGRSVLLLGRDGNTARCWTLEVTSGGEPVACSGAASPPDGALLLALVVQAGTVIGVGVDHDARPGIWTRAVEQADAGREG